MQGATAKKESSGVWRAGFRCTLGLEWGHGHALDHEGLGARGNGVSFAITVSGMRSRTGAATHCGRASGAVVCVGVWRGERGGRGQHASGCGRRGLGVTIKNESSDALRAGFRCGVHVGAAWKAPTNCKSFLQRLLALCKAVGPSSAQHPLPPALGDPCSRSCPFPLHPGVASWVLCIVRCSCSGWSRSMGRL